MLLGYAVLLVIGSILTAAATDAGMFIVGHIIQGLCTSLLLIAAVPPLAIGYPANKLRDTAVIMNICIFGAVALGPFVGGLQAESNAWVCPATQCKSSWDASASAYRLSLIHI